MSLRVYIFSLSSAYEESILESMEESEPIANEKAITPINIKKQAIIFSVLLKA